MDKKFYPIGLLYYSAYDSDAKLAISNTGKISIEPKHTGISSVISTITYITYN